jgi:hypothetical protein
MAGTDTRLDMFAVEGLSWQRIKGRGAFVSQRASRRRLGPTVLERPYARGAHGGFAMGERCVDFDQQIGAPKGPPG